LFLESESARSISALIRSDPTLADWWIRVEEAGRPSKPLVGFFRNDRASSRHMKNAVVNQRAMVFGERLGENPYSISGASRCQTFVGERGCAVAIAVVTC
jgi:hypothetical protein